MSNQTLTRLAEERETQETFIAELLQQAEAETRDLVETEVRSVETATNRIKEIDEQMAPLVEFEQRRASAIDLSKLGKTPKQTASTEVTETRSLGQMFVESAQFEDFQARGFSGRSDVYRIEDFEAIRAASDAIMTTVDPGKKYLPNPQKFVRDAVLVPHPLLSLVTSIEVSTNSVDFLVVGEASGADVVPEGELKPPVSWTETEASFKLETIAGWKKYTRQAAEDIPQLVSLIDQKIRRAIDNKLNEKAVAALAGAKTAGNTTTGEADQPLLEVIRVAIGELQSRSYGAQAVLMNPADYATLDVFLMHATNNGAVINGSAFGSTIIPVVGVTAGTAIVGDVGEALAYFHKRGLSIYSTDSDVSDGAAGAVISDFRSNKLTTLGEVRGVFGAVDASAIQFAVSA